MSNIPHDLRYTTDHEWLRDSGAVHTVGISQFAVDQLGDITLVELPAIGRTVAKGDAVGTIESVKSVSEIYAPVSGTIKRINERLKDEPELVNSAPYGDGWMLEIEPSDQAELAGLMDAAAYEAHLAAQ
ncbi:MAG TPA: glycine cleavage system protein GcvH [Kofleriaceae bacterium]|jgi:glycine cleavage system H protein